MGAHHTFNGVESAACLAGVGEFAFVLLLNDILFLAELAHHVVCLLLLHSLPGSVALLLVLDFLELPQQAVYFRLPGIGFTRCLLQDPGQVFLLLDALLLVRLVRFLLSLFLGLLESL
jgi:hypothetical protein